MLCVDRIGPQPTDEWAISRGNHPDLIASLRQRPGERVRDALRPRVVVRVGLEEHDPALRL